MSVSLLVIYTLTAFTISVLFFPVLIKLLQQWNLFDKPGDHKIHQDFTPSMGGVCIVLGVIFTLLISFNLQEWIHLKYFFVAMAIMFITGLRDDILALDPIRKLIGQFLPVVILVVFGNVYLNSFYGTLDVIIFPTWLGWIITVFTIIILTNAYNLIDGLDGLAGTIGLIILCFFGCWFYLSDYLYYSILAFSFCGSVLAFLIFNWQPSKIFMGDTGSLTIGLLLSYLSIHFINTNYSLPENFPTRFQASIGTVVCVLIIPIFDTLRVIVLRLRRFESPFHADRNHLHHQFLNLGFNHSQATLILGAINIGFIFLAWILRNNSDKLILPVVIVICLIINQILKVAQRKHGVDSGKGSIS